MTTVVDGGTDLYREMRAGDFFFFGVLGFELIVGALSLETYCQLQGLGNF
jgi:hypothetical protein